LIEELNEEQRAAVLYNDGASLVIAGAGSGKTRVLTYKIAYLLEHGYHPWNILALTFTNKAAREMKERIARQVGNEQARRLWMGTFHSIFLHILHREAASIGFTSRFTVYDTSDSKSLIRSIIREMGLNDKQYKPASVQAHISNAKNRLLTPDRYASDRQAYEIDSRAGMGALRDIYQRYWMRCRQADAMDFDDLLIYTFLLFQQHPEVLERYRQQFQYILVDEYQDTNFAQHSIIMQLASEHQHICVVGDDAQSIYSFRGANIDNILSFTQVFGNAKTFKLEQNYRSTQAIVNAANSLIKKNSRQIPKEVFSKNAAGDTIEVLQAYSDMEEGLIVAGKIAELCRREHYTYADFAILYRTNAQSRIFEEALRKREITYRIYGGMSFYQRKEIKDVVAYFRLVVNPNDEEAFKRIINYPARGIGETTVNKIIAAANAANVSLWTVINAPDAYALTVNKGTLGKLQGFAGLIAGFAEGVFTKNAYEAGTDIIRRSGIMNDMLGHDPEDESRRENIEELVNGLSNFCSERLEEDNEHILLSDFLSGISLATDQDTDTDKTNTDKVTLMTVHAAKGLEFKNVFVVGMEESLFPSGMVGDSPRAMEEERRLFYVAITRAQEHCFLSYAKSRMRYGQMDFCTPSRFLHDIDPRFLNSPLSAPSQQRLFAAPSAAKPPYPSSSPTMQKPPYSSSSPTMSKQPAHSAPNSSAPAAAHASSAAFNMKVGQQVEHERFGIGEVIRIAGEGENTKATIRFKNAGEKQLLLRFARFK
jgi:DNA helicase-2/ATP-dependent DNA helicase PcrA